MFALINAEFALTVSTVTGLSIVPTLERQNGVRWDDNLFASLSRRYISVSQSSRRLSSCGWCVLRFIGDGTTTSLAERIVSSTIDGLAFTEANTNVTLESNVIARREFKSVERCQQAIGLGAVLPFTKDARICGASILVRHYVLVLHTVFHRFCDAGSCESSIDGWINQCTIVINNLLYIKDILNWLTSWLDVNLQH